MLFDVFSKSSKSSISDVEKVTSEIDIFEHVEIVDFDMLKKCSEIAHRIQASTNLVIILRSRTRDLRTQVPKTVLKEAGIAGLKRLSLIN